MVETILLIIGLMLTLLSVSKGRMRPLPLVLGAVALYFSFNPPDFFNDSLIGFFAIAFSIWFLIDFRRGKIRLVRLPIVAGLIGYFFFREQSEVFIMDIVLKYLPENQFPLWTGVIVIVIVWWIIARFVRRNSIRKG